MTAGEEMYEQANQPALSPDLHANLQTTQVGFLEEPTTKAAVVVEDPWSESMR